MSAASFPDQKCEGKILATASHLYKESVGLQDLLYCMCDINFHLGGECRNVVSHPKYEAVLCH